MMNDPTQMYGQQTPPGMGPAGPSQILQNQAVQANNVADPRISALIQQLQTPISPSPQHGQHGQQGQPDQQGQQQPNTRGLGGPLAALGQITKAYDGSRMQGLNQMQTQDFWSPTVTAASD